MSVTKIKVTAPADLREGYTFDASVDGKTVGIFLCLIQALKMLNQVDYHFTDLHFFIVL